MVVNTHVEYNININIPKYRFKYKYKYKCEYEYKYDYDCKYKYECKYKYKWIKSTKHKYISTLNCTNLLNLYHFTSYLWSFVSPIDFHLCDDLGPIHWPRARCDVPLVRVFRPEPPLPGWCPRLLGRHAISKHAAGQLYGLSESSDGGRNLDPAGVLWTNTCFFSSTSGYIINWYWYDWSRHLNLLGSRNDDIWHV